MKLALQAAAKVADITMAEAARTVRKHPLLEEEIHISEELINLEESLQTHGVGSEVLKSYPKLQRHIQAEQKQIIKHSIGLIDRMLHQRRLPRHYTRHDTEYSLKKLIRLIVAEAQLVNKEIDDDVMKLLRPFLTRRQRFASGERPAPVQFVFRKLARQ